MKKIFWVFPDRGSAAQKAAEHDNFWREYDEAVARAGMRLGVVSAEAIDMVYAQGDPPTTFVRGERVDPSDTIFVTELYTFPHQKQDALMQITTYGALEASGFYLPVPPTLSAVMNDKFATYLYFKEADLNVLPSVRLTAGRDVEERDLEVLLGSFGFPLVVKPSSWGSGQGVAVARSWSELRSILGLASGCEATMILQPWIGSDRLVDYRVYFVGGRPHTVLGRIPQKGEVVANLSRGGRADIVEMPPNLMAQASRAAALIDLPYFCVDFLFDGETYWLSEVELDGAVGYIEKDRLQKILVDRFEAYDSAHEAWLEGRRRGLARVGG